MEVKLRTFQGYNIGTREKHTLDRYWVDVDGVSVGFVMWKNPGHVIFIRRNIGPLEKERICEDVAALMKSRTRGFSEPPDVPDELLNREKGEDFYEFDEEDVAGEGGD